MFKHLRGKTGGRLKHQRSYRVPDRKDTDENYQEAEPTFCGWLETDLPPSPSNQDRADRERQYRLEQKKYRTEVATLVAVAIAATIYYCQLNTMQATLSESYKPILELTKYPGEPEFTPEGEGIKVAWSLDYTNDGRGIARSPWSEFQVSFTEPDEADRVMLPSDKPWKSPELQIKPGDAPNERIFYFSRTNKDFAQRLARWKAGNGWLNAQVVFHYQDEAGQPHGSSVCRSFNAGYAPHAQVVCAAKDANGVW